MPRSGELAPCAARCCVISPLKNIARSAYYVRGDPAMDWTKPTDLADQVSRHWAQGRILAAKISGPPLFPLRLRWRRPDTKALGERFEQVRAWIRELEEEAGPNADLATTSNGLTSTIVNWAATKHGRLKIGDQRLAPKIRLVKPRIRKTACQRLCDTHLTRGNIARFHTTRICPPETALAGWAAYRTQTGRGQQFSDIGTTKRHLKPVRVPSYWHEATPSALAGLEVDHELNPGQGAA